MSRRPFQPLADLQAGGAGFAVDENCCMQPMDASSCRDRKHMEKARLAAVIAGVETDAPTKRALRCRSARL